MRRKFIIKKELVALFLCNLMLFSGGCGNNVSQEEYNATAEELKSVKEELKSSQNEISELESEHKNIKEELVLESGSFDALLERTRFAIPELLELNSSEVQPFSLTFKSERHERMVL